MRFCCGIIILFLIFGICSSGLLAQESAVLGYSGYFVVPSAKVAADGQVLVGMAHTPELYATGLKPYKRTSAYARLGYLPFLEGTAMVNHPDGYDGGMGDRSIHLKLQFFDEKGRRPALAIGVQDFFAIEGLGLEPWKAQHFAALYMVTSRTFTLPYKSRLLLSLGYGTDRLPARTHYLVGLFGGFSFSPHRLISVLAEYDAKKVNVGLRLHLFSHLHILLGYWKLEHFTPSAALSFSL